MPRISVKKEKAPRKSAKAAAENLPAETPGENPLPVAAPVEPVKVEAPVVAPAPAEKTEVPAAVPAPAVNGTSNP